MNLLCITREQILICMQLFHYTMLFIEWNHAQLNKYILKNKYTKPRKKKHTKDQKKKKQKQPSSPHPTFINETCSCNSIQTFIMFILHPRIQSFFFYSNQSITMCWDARVKQQQSKAFTCIHPPGKNICALCSVQHKIFLIFIYSMFSYSSFF